MVKLQHPSFPDVTREVDDADEQAWLDAGWIAAPEPVIPADPALTPDTEPAAPAVPYTAPEPDSMDTSGDETHN